MTNLEDHDDYIDGVVEAFMEKVEPVLREFAEYHVRITRLARAGQHQSPTVAPSGPEFIGIPEVSRRTGVPEGTLRYWRYSNQGPPSTKFGRRVVYRAVEVQKWIDQQFDGVPE